MRKYIIIFMLLLLTDIALAQNLKDLYKKAYELSDLSLAKRVKDLAIAQGNKRIAANSYFLIAYLYNAKDSLFEAIDNYFAASKFYQDIGDDKLVAQVFENIGSIYDIAGFKQAAVHYYYSVLAVKSNYNDSIGLRQTHYNLGEIYKSVKEFDSAMWHYDKALKFNVTSSDSFVGRIYNEIGIVHYDIGEYVEACNYYGLADQHDSSSAMKARTLNNRGNAYLKQGDNKIADRYFKQALELDTSQVEEKTLSTIYFNLGQMQLSRDSAILYYQQSFELIKDKPMSRAERYYDLVSKLKQLYRLKHNEDKVLYYDSLQDQFTNELVHLNDELKTSYLHYQVEAATWKMKSELNRKNQILLYTIIVLLAISCICIIYYTLYKKGKRREKRIVKQAREVYEILKS